MKLILFLCKLFKISVFEDDAKGLKFVTKHAIKRAEKRLSYELLLNIATEQVLEKGTRAVHFEYVNSQTTEYAKLYKGYIWVFGNQKKLITVYASNNIADLFITRK